MRGYKNRGRRHTNAVFILLLLVACSFSSEAVAQQGFPLTRVEYDSVMSCGNLHLTPIRFVSERGEAQKDLPLLSWQQAMVQRKISVGEVKADAGSDVALLEIKNYSSSYVLINAGELITGGKQDRLSAETVIVPPGREKFFLNVFCAEKGRWDRREKRFYYAGEAGYEIKKLIHRGKKQHDIWKAIDWQLLKHKVVSETSAYAAALSGEVLSPNDSTCFRFFIEEKRKRLPHFAGFVISAGEKVIACEVFAAGNITDIRFPELVKKYLPVGSQITEIKAYNKEAVKAFMTPFYSSEKISAQYIAEKGAAYRYNGRIFHIVLYGD